MANGCYWGEDGGADEAYVSDTIANNLRRSDRLQRQLLHGPRPEFFVTPKLGIYDNIIQNNFGAQLGNGTIATQNSYPGLYYPVHSCANSFSVLTQIDVGRIGRLPSGSRQGGLPPAGRHRHGPGRRPDSAVPQRYPGHPGYRSNGHLVLNGAFAGLTILLSKP